MPFHCQTKPPVIMKTIENDFKLIRKGTSYEDLFIEEGGPYIIICFLLILNYIMMLINGIL